MKRFICCLTLITLLITACHPKVATLHNKPRILAIESFLADIAQNIAGDRMVVESLIPVEVDPHAYQPTPQDAAKLVNADILILNGANLESFIAPMLQTLRADQLIITASIGLEAHPDPSGKNTQGDPHFWLDPNNVAKYAENIRDGFSKFDPTGALIFAENTRKYMVELTSLDSWISEQVRSIPETHRLLVTNHEVFGYFAARYGFTIVGAIVPSVTSGAAPSAEELAALINQIRSTRASAIFLEKGANPQLADQLAAETGVRVITDLFTHSLSAPDGPAPTYIAMMKYDVTVMVEALK